MPCWRRVFIVVLMSLVSPVLSVAASPQRHTSARPLPKKKNPLFIGRRDINRHQLNFYSLEREQALGEQLAAQVDLQVPLVRDPIVTEYINRIGQNLALHSDIRVPLTIKVIASDEVNAFALPGGFLYVNLGVLKAADTEAELAGVMAHEIAHVAARHALENLSKNELFSLGTIPLIFLGGPMGEWIRTGTGYGLAALFFKFSRGAEREADELAAQYLWATGYDPWSLVRFFQKLMHRERPIRISPLFRTHPTTPNRIRNLRQLIARFPPRQSYVTNTSEFAAVKDHVSGTGRIISGSQPTRSPGRRQPPVLHRRTSDGAPRDETSGRRSSFPPVEHRHPPILHRRTSDASSPPAESRETESTVRPPSRQPGSRQPPKLIRRTSPDEPSEEQRSESPPWYGHRRDDSSVRLGRPTPPLSHGRPLRREPPKLRRRF